MSGALTFVYLGIIEGLTEFIPVSSSGHLILVRHFFGLSTGNDLAVDAVLQLAAAAALVVYFWRDIWELVQFKNMTLLWAIIIGTIPALIIGLLLESTMESTFRSPVLVAYTLIVGSLIFIAAEWALKKYSVRKEMATLGWKDSLIVGFWQSLALIPGMSRSGMTIAGGMIQGFSRADAARFGFLLSLPILFGSGLKKFYELDAGGALLTIGAPLLWGSLAAFLTGLAAIYILMIVVRRTPLTVFAVYRIALAILILLLN